MTIRLQAALQDFDRDLSADRQIIGVKNMRRPALAQE
jgi:hypothetical protein